MRSVDANQPDVYSAAQGLESKAGMANARRPAPAALSFQWFFRQNAPFVWRTLRYLGVAESDLEDASQEVFLVVHRRLGEFEWRSAATTWLYSIAANVAGNYRTRAHRRHEQVTEPEQIPERSVSAPQLEQIAHAQARLLLAEIVSCLDDEKRAVFVLADIEQVPMAEVAATMGCPLQTAYARLHAARKTLAAELRRRALVRLPHDR